MRDQAIDFSSRIISSVRRRRPGYARLDEAEGRRPIKLRKRTRKQSRKQVRNYSEKHSKKHSKKHSRKHSRK
jgi:hypothetical protein